MHDYPPEEPQTVRNCRRPNFQQDTQCRPCRGVSGGDMLRCINVGGRVFLFSIVDDA